jgi:LCP family protein required for cell wall assembly
VVTIPGDTVVNVPGVGTKPLWDAFETGGASLLVRTVSQLTGVPINHYARVDFSHITSLVNAIGGVDVTLPDTTKSFGYTFHAGVNHLTGVNAIYYARDPSLSDEDRLLRQEVLIRAILTKIADDHLVTNPVTVVRVLNAITSTLTVDSNLTNSGIESLTRKFGTLSSSAATFVTAPTKTVKGKLVLNTAIADPLWTAIKHDSIAGFAATYPSTVTPLVAP